MDKNKYYKYQVQPSTEMFVKHFPPPQNIDVYFYNLYKMSNDIQITQLPVYLLYPVTIY